MNEFTIAYKEIPGTIDQYLTILGALSDYEFTGKKNSQNRSVKQILGHMIDSASNNTHRVVHLQYRESPVEFPNYATNGNNDRWIAIQNYQEEDKELLLSLWKYAHLHIIHVVDNIQEEKLQQEWIDSAGQKVTLKEMVLDFPRHFFLHINEIDELIHA